MSHHRVNVLAETPIFHVGHAGTGKGTGAGKTEPAPGATSGLPQHHAAAAAAGTAPVLKPASSCMAAASQLMSHSNFALVGYYIAIFPHW